MDRVSALLGVVVGGFLSFMITWFMSRSEWRRRTSIRWDEAKLVAYSEYVNEAKAVATIAVRLAAGYGLNPGYTQNLENVVLVDQAEGRVLLSEAEARRSVKLESVLLLGDKDTVGSALALTRALWKLEAKALNPSTGPTDWHDAFVGYRSSRASFYRHARASMGLSHVELPPTWIPQLAPTTDQDEVPQPSGAP